MTGGPVRSSDAMDLAEVARVLLRGWRVIASAFVVCVLGGVAVLIWVPPVWTAHSSVLAKDTQPLGGAITQQISGVLGAGAASALLGGGGLKSDIETDIALLKSRELIGEVVDSVGLVASVTSPKGTPPHSVVAATEFTGPFRPLTLRLAGDANGIRVTGKDVDTVVAAGGSVRFHSGTIRLAESPLVPSKVKLRDREETITRLGKRIGVDVLGGDLIGISWPSGDSLSAPEAANVLVSRFLVRRRGADRSINVKKLDFVTAQIDSVDRALEVALRSQREFHTRARSVEMAAAAKAYLESLLRLREQREVLVMEEEALASLLNQLKNRTLEARQLGAYPAFLRSPAIAEMLGRVGALDAEREALLKQQRRDDDPRVAGLRASVASLEAELEPLAQTYSASITDQRAALDKEVALVTARLDQLPDQVEEAFKHSADVERLAKTSLALNAQRVELRLATVGEGGDARAIDVAQPQWRRSFPRRSITLLAAGFAGLAIGAALVLGGVGARTSAGDAGPSA